MKIYIYNDKETANKVARTIYKEFGISVEQRGTALKINEEMYDTVIFKCNMPRANWEARSAYQHAGAENAQNS